jgi:type II secretory pathway component PulK
MWHASPNTVVSPRRRGSAYVMVLVLGIILAVIGAASVAVSRGTMRTMTDSKDWGEAQSLAFSGVEHALLKLNLDSNWRTTFSGQTCQKSLGRPSTGSPPVRRSRWAPPRRRA